MNIFERQERAEKNAFKLDTHEGTRKKMIEEMIDENHILVQEIKGPYWIKKYADESENKEHKTLKENREQAINKTAEKFGFESQLVMEVFEELQKREEEERQKQEKQILEKRRRGV